MDWIDLAQVRTGIGLLWVR